jgi:hypothetical protein
MPDNTACSDLAVPNDPSTLFNGYCESGTCTRGCFIGGAFYAANASNPANACQTCQPATSETSWSTAPNGTTCSGSNPCLVYTCESGTCTATENVTGGTKVCGQLGLPGATINLYCCSGVCTLLCSNGTCPSGACGCGFSCGGGCCQSGQICVTAGDGSRHCCPKTETQYCTGDATFYGQSQGSATCCPTSCTVTQFGEVCPCIGYGGPCDSANPCCSDVTCSSNYGGICQ